HPPHYTAGDDVVRVGGEAAALEAAVDVRGDALEIAVDLRVPIRVGVREGVLLVGAQRELTPGRAAESEPRPWNGGRPVRLEGEIEQPDRERVELEREHAADVHGTEPSVQQCEKEAAEVLRDSDELLLVGCTQNRVAKGEWAAHLDAHQVGG